MNIDIRGINSAQEIRETVRKAYEEAGAIQSADIDGNPQTFDQMYDGWVQHYTRIGAAQGPARQPRLQAEREAAATLLSFLLK